MTKDRSGYKQIGEICSFTNGYGFKSSDWSTRGLPIIRIQNLNGSTSFNYYDKEVTNDRIVVNAGDLLFAWAGVRGVSFGPTIWNGQKGLLNQHIYKITPKKGIERHWLYLAIKHVTSKIELSAHGFKSSLVHVKKSDIASQEVYCPPPSSQRVISSIISCWEASISKSEAIIAAKELRKRWLMGLFFFKRYPPSREKRLCAFLDLFEIVTRKATSSNLEPLSITASVGFVCHKEKWSKEMAGKSFDNYTHIKNGEFAYNKGNSKSYPCGCIYQLKGYAEGAVPNVYICFAVKNKECNRSYYDYLFESGWLNTQLRRKINSGVRNDGLLNINISNFSDIKIPKPEMSEQAEIATVLTLIDQDISAEKARLAHLKIQKAGLIQQLLTGKTPVL